VKRVALLSSILCLIALSLPLIGRDTVKLHLKWMHGAQFAGVYAAETIGAFDRADLEVELVPGPATEVVLQEVAEGLYDFVLADPSALLARVAQGLDLVAISAIFQIDPVVIFSLAEAGIERPEDLAGKRIMSFESSYVVQAVLGRVGLSEDDVELGPSSFNLNELYRGEYDAWTGYITNEVRQARADGHDVQVIFPTDYGVHLYGDVLVTRRELIVGSPDLVARVVASLLEGWRWVLAHAEEAAELALAWDPDLDLETEREILESSLPFIHAGDVQLGGMTTERWSAMARVMKSFGLLSPTFDPKLAHTLEFVSPEEDGTP